MPAVEIPNPLSEFVTPDRRVTQITREYLQGLDGYRRVTITTLPPPQEGYVCYVLDTIDGGRPCYADGTDWRRFDTNAVVT
jgi:hypothetical protein